MQFVVTVSFNILFRVTGSSILVAFLPSAAIYCRFLFVYIYCPYLPQWFLKPFRCWKLPLPSFCHLLLMCPVFHFPFLTLELLRAPTQQFHRIWWLLFYTFASISSFLPGIPCPIQFCQQFSPFAWLFPPHWQSYVNKYAKAFEHWVVRHLLECSKFLYFIVK